jgi:hypothetical protein
MPRPRKSNAPPKDAESCRHPDADLPARPEIGAQAHFIKVIDPRGNELLAVKKLEEGK